MCVLARRLWYLGKADIASPKAKHRASLEKAGRLLTTTVQRLSENLANRRVQTCHPAKRAALILQIFGPKHRHLCKHKHQRRMDGLTAARSRRPKPAVLGTGDLGARGRATPTQPCITSLSWGPPSRFSKCGHARCSREAMREFGDRRCDLWHRGKSAARLHSYQISEPEGVATVYKDVVPHCGLRPISQGPARVCWMSNE